MSDIRLLLMPELSEMMIRVTVAPHQPLVARERAEDGMSGVACVWLGKAANENDQCVAVAFEFCGLRAGAAGIDFGSRRDALRPWQRCVQRDPPAHGPHERGLRRRRRPLTEHRDV